jgi:hypothetical protein
LTKEKDCFMQIGVVKKLIEWAVKYARNET